MDRKKLEKLKIELNQLRRSPQKAAAYEALAKRLGRTKVDRGKHPMWENPELPGSYALSIPNHAGKDIPIGTRNSILNQLETDIFAWEEKLPED